MYKKPGPKLSPINLLKSIESFGKVCETFKRFLYISSDFPVSLKI